MTALIIFAAVLALIGIGIYLVVWSIENDNQSWSNLGYEFKKPKPEILSVVRKI